jgi:uncharacterized protein (DUF302 family)
MLGRRFRNYHILGTRNPTLAYDALQLEDKVGTMLPCNLVVRRPPEATRPLRLKATVQIAPPASESDRCRRETQLRYQICPDRHQSSQSL